MKNERHDLLLLSRRISEYQNALAARDTPGLSIHPAGTVEEAAGPATHCDIFLGDLDLMRPLLKDARNLRWVQSGWAGVNLLTRRPPRSDYILTGVRDIFGPIIAEYVLCYMLMHERRALQRMEAQRENRWDGSRPGSLTGKTVGIMGVGSIGRHIAGVLKTLGMKTVGYTRKSEPDDVLDAVFHTKNKTAFLAALDYLILLLPDTPETDDIIDETALAAMKPSAVLINAGRGNVIRESALMQALENGTIAGAVLDVFRKEPLPPDHPFWTTPNLILTFHTAGVSPIEEISAIFAENYRRYISGAPLRYIIDFNRGY